MVVYLGPLSDPVRFYSAPEVAWTKGWAVHQQVQLFRRPRDGKGEGHSGTVAFEEWLAEPWRAGPAQLGLPFWSNGRRSAGRKCRPLGHIPAGQ